MTLIELLALVAIGAVLFFVFVSFRSSRCGPINPRLLCGSNLKGIGTAFRIYANDNDERWPVPAFDESAIGHIDYTVRVGGGEGSVRSPSRDQPSISGRGGARQLSVTRTFWTLVRSGDVTVDQFVCPQSKDIRDSTSIIDLYYDFTGYENISYGYQVPFGPLVSRPTESVDNRMVLAADKGPYRSPADLPPPTNIQPLPSGPSYSRNPQQWRAFNSRNHNGEGQNVLYADGHVSFRRTPTAGINGDNIYTVALDDQSESGRMVGESPWARSAHPFISSIGLFK